jgi:hypothetical protein
LLPRVVGQGFGEIYGVQLLNNHIDGHLWVIISMFIDMSRGRRWRALFVWSAVNPLLLSIPVFRPYGHMLPAGILLRVLRLPTLVPHRGCSRLKFALGEGSRCALGKLQ